MDLFNNAAVIWFIAGFVFLLLEFILPGLILFFFAVAAWIVAIVTLFTDISVNTQLIIFLVTTVLTILLFRKWVQKMIWVKKHPTEIEDELLGKTATAETNFGPGEDGKVNFRGTQWQARSDDNITTGEKVIITGNDSILLIVKSNKISL